MSEKLLQAGQAAARLGMPRSTFDEKYESLGLMPVILDHSFKSAKRWLESEIDAFIEKRIQARNAKVQADNKHQRDILNLVRQKRSA
jgi:predicted DNA-binding transcriptional regulator AlpA